MKLREKIKELLVWEGSGQRVRYLHFLRNLRDLKIPQEATILDAGAGRGVYSVKLAKKFPHSSITAIDIDENELSILKERVKEAGISNVSVKKKSITSSLGKNRYDLIICVDVIEHLRDDYLVIKTLFDSLKPGGLVYLHTPSLANRRYFKEFQNFPHQHDPVREGYDKEDLIKLLDVSGFTILKSRYTFGLFGALSWELGKKALKENGFLRLFYAILSLVIAPLDILFVNKIGNGLLILASKPSKELRSWKKTKSSIKLEYLNKFISGKTVLDIGVGPGFYSEYLATKGLEVTAVDTEKQFEPTRVKFVKANVENLPFEQQSFDTILCFDVLEHVKNDRHALKEISRVAKKRLILSVPKRVEENLIRYDVTYKHYIDKTHYREYSKEEIQKVVSEVGFEIKVLNYEGSISPYITAEFFKGKILKTAVLIWLKVFNKIGLLDFKNSTLLGNIFVVADRGPNEKNSSHN